MWPYSWTDVGTPSHLGHMDRVAATMPSQAHAGAAQEAPNIGQWEGQDFPLVRPSSCIVKGGILSSRRYLPTYLQSHNLRVDRGYYTGDFAQAVVSISHRGRDCWCLRLTGALTTRSGNRGVLRSPLEIMEGKALVFGHQLLEYNLIKVTHGHGV